MSLGDPTRTDVDADLGGLDRAAYDAVLDGRDVSSLNNVAQAGRIPPNDCCFINPAGIRGLYGPADFFQKLQDEMPDPVNVPPVREEFSMAMGTGPVPDAPEPTHINPVFNVGKFSA